MDDFHIEILRNLVSFNTVTPAIIDIMFYCRTLFESWGGTVKIHQSGNVPNLVAYIGNSVRTLCIAGHLDIVEPGNNWQYAPFILTEKDGKLYGRGTNDMKGPLSAMLAAVHDFIQKPSDLSIMILLTGDEEVMTDNGMHSLMQYVTQFHKRFDLCILPESCSPDKAGEYIKIGCKGSMNIDISSHAPQGHVVNVSNNHLHCFIDTVHKLINLHIDNGNDMFEPSKLQLTSIDVGNTTRNIVPSNISAEFNVRFNTARTSNQLKFMINELIPKNINRKINILSEPFIGCSVEWQNRLRNVVSRILNKPIKLGTFGGNSDAKTLHKYMDVVEIGSPLGQAHIADEFILKSELDKLRNMYYELIVSIANQKWS